MSPYAPETAPHPVITPCKRGCCWTPHGHSQAVENYPRWHPRACRCHTKGAKR